MITQLTENGLCWAILLLALYCYQQLCTELILVSNNNSGSHSNKNADNNRQQMLKSQQQQQFSSLLIGTLPLLGLFGTIAGLLDCFFGMASDGTSSELISRGISDALLTTQLGITCALPAWLLHAYVKACWDRKSALVDIQSTDTVAE